MGGHSQKFKDEQAALENVQNESSRHPSVEALLKFFESNHLPDELQKVSAPCGYLAEQMADSLPDNAELTVGLRKLLEAKDCFVRAALSR